MWTLYVHAPLVLLSGPSKWHLDCLGGDQASPVRYLSLSPPVDAPKELFPEDGRGGAVDEQVDRGSSGEQETLHRFCDLYRINQNWEKIDLGNVGNRIQEFDC